MRIKKGDNVQILSGNDKGKTGEVLEVIPKADKVVVKGANIRKKHVKPRKQGEEGKDHHGERISPLRHMERTYRKVPWRQGTYA